MKVIVFALIAGLCVTLSKAQDDKYTSKYDNIDLDEILHSDRLLNNYVNCLLDKGSCTPDGAELKRVLKEAFETDCTKCNDKQKAGAKKVITFLIKEKRPTWTEIQAKYDPDNNYVKTYEADLKASGITL